MEDMRGIYSSNVGHFCQLHAELVADGRNHDGIVLCKQQQYSIGEQMRRLLKLIAALVGRRDAESTEFLSSWS